MWVATLSLTDTYGAAVAHYTHMTPTMQRFSCFLFVCFVRDIEKERERERECVCVCHRCKRLWSNTSSVFSWNPTYHDFHTDVDWFGMTVVRTHYFSRTCFCDDAIAISFLQDAKLIRSQVLRDTCRRFMTCSADPTRSDGFRWRCSRVMLLSGVVSLRVRVHLSRNPTDNSRERSSLSFSALHWPFLLHGLQLERFGVICSNKIARQ